MRWTMEPRALTRARRSGAEHRWEAAAEWPVMVAAVAFVLVFFASVLAPAWAARNSLFVSVAAGTVWTVLAVDYVARLVLAADRVRFLRSHVFELVTVAIPALRPLTAFFVLVNRRGVLSTRGRLAQRALLYVCVLAVVLAVLSAGAMVLVERNAPGARITTFPEGLWWAVVTMTSVGYGDLFPVTVEGRLVAVVAIAIGIALVGTITATVATWFIERTDRGAASPSVLDVPIPDADDQTAASIAPSDLSRADAPVAADASGTARAPATVDAGIAELLAEVRALRREVAELRAGR